MTKQVTWAAPPHYKQLVGEVVTEVPAGVHVDVVLNHLVRPIGSPAIRFRGAARARHTRVLVKSELRPHYPVYYAVAPERLQEVGS